MQRKNAGAKKIAEQTWKGQNQSKQTAGQKATYKHVRQNYKVEMQSQNRCNKCRAAIKIAKAEKPRPTVVKKWLSLQGFQCHLFPVWMLSLWLLLLVVVVQKLNSATNYCIGVCYVAGDDKVMFWTCMFEWHLRTVSSCIFLIIFIQGLAKRVRAIGIPVNWSRLPQYKNRKVLHFLVATFLLPLEQWVDLLIFQSKNSLKIQTIQNAGQWRKLMQNTSTSIHPSANLTCSASTELESC